MNVRLNPVLRTPANPPSASTRCDYTVQAVHHV